MIECSACGAEFPKEEGWEDRSETRFDYFCPSCDAGVIPDGDAEEIRRQREVQQKIISDIQDLAEETKTPSYVGPQHSVKYLKERLQKIVKDIDAELERRNE